MLTETSKLKTRINYLENELIKRNKETADKDMKTSEFLVFGMKNTILELRKELSLKVSENQALKKNLKVSRLEECQTQVVALSEECLRLKRKLQEALACRAPNNSENMEFKFCAKYKMKNKKLLDVIKEKDLNILELNKRVADLETFLKRNNGRGESGVRNSWNHLENTHNREAEKIKNQMQKEFDQKIKENKEITENYEILKKKIQEQLLELSEKNKEVRNLQEFIAKNINSWKNFPPRLFRFLKEKMTEKNLEISEFLKKNFLKELVKVDLFYKKLQELDSKVSKSWILEVFGFVKKSGKVNLNQVQVLFEQFSYEDESDEESFDMIQNNAFTQTGQSATFVDESAQYSIKSYENSSPSGKKNKFLCESSSSVIILDAEKGSSFPSRRSENYEKNENFEENGKNTEIFEKINQIAKNNENKRHGSEFSNQSGKIDEKNEESSQNNKVESIDEKYEENLQKNDKREKIDEKIEESLLKNNQSAKIIEKNEEISQNNKKSERIHKKNEESSQKNKIGKTDEKNRKNLKNLDNKPTEEKEILKNIEQEDIIKKTPSKNEKSPTKPEQNEKSQTKPEQNDQISKKSKIFEFIEVKQSADFSSLPFASNSIDLQNFPEKKESIDFVSKFPSNMKNSESAVSSNKFHEVSAETKSLKFSESKKPSENPLNHSVPTKDTLLIPPFKTSENEKPLEKSLAWFSPREKNPEIKAKQEKTLLRHFSLRSQLNSFPLSELSYQIFTEKTPSEKVSHIDFELKLESNLFNFTSAQSKTISRFYLFQEPLTLDLLNVKFTETLENWKILTSSEELKKSEDLNFFFSRNSAQIDKICKNVDTQNSGKINSFKFFRLLKENKIEFPERLLKYFELICYKVDYFLDQVPYLSLLQDFLSRNSKEEKMKQKNMKTVEYYLSLMAKRLANNRKEAKTVFKANEQGLISTDRFLQGLNELNLSEIPQKDKNVLLDSFSHSASEEHFIRFKELEALLNLHGAQNFARISEYQGPESPGKISEWDSMDLDSIAYTPVSNVNNLDFE